MSKLLTKLGLLAAVDLKTRDVPVPQWNGDVRIQELDKAGRDAVQAIWASKEGDEIEKFQQVGDILLIQGIVGEDNKPLFEKTELPELKKKNGDALGMLINEMMQLNGFSKKKPVEDATKNSSGAPSADSLSASPLPSAARLPNSAAE